MRLVSRSGQTMNPTYPELVEAVEAQELPDLVADGEIVAFERGRTSFARLQRRMQIHDPERARRSGVAVYLYLFDLLELGGEDLRPAALRERKRRLRGAVAVPRPAALDALPRRRRRGRLPPRLRPRLGGRDRQARRQPVRAGPLARLAQDQVRRGQELVIGGWTAGRGARRRLGALLLGYWEGDRLRYAGKVGTGFDSLGGRPLGG